MPKLTSTHSRQKGLYRVKNWSEYEKALVQRGSITFWMSDDFAKKWHYAGKKEQGSPFDYSDESIVMMLTIKEVYHLSNRQTEGFVRSLFEMLNINLGVPDHSTLSRRAKGLQVKLPKRRHENLNIVMDSTGMKIFGEGEWKVRMHGVSKRRTWRKLHIGSNPADGEIQAVLLTENSVSDDQAAEELLEQVVGRIIDFAADGAYDTRKVYNCLNAHSPDVNILIPPRKGAHIWKHANTKGERLQRDQNLRYIRKHGRKKWRDFSGYHQRSSAETTMFRLKTIFSDQLSARLLETQITQALIRCAALNKMNHLGRPQSFLRI